MKCQRLIFELGDGAFTIDLHPRLTVFAGLGPVERAALAGELLGALEGTRTGVHLELRDAAGRALALLRPTSGDPTVVDVATGEDCTDRFGTAAGPGLDLRQAADLHVDAAALRAPVDPQIDRLARLDQKRLWAAAEHVARTERHLNEEATAVGPLHLRSELADLIEERHQHLEAARARSALARRVATLAGAVSALAAVPFAAFEPGLALPPLAITTLAMLHAEVTRRGIERAEEAEQLALAEVGAQSYLGFHIQRVDGMLSSAENRKRLATAADLHRKALATWQDLVGSVEVRWAFEHRDRIIRRALILRELDGRAGSHQPALADPVAAAAGAMLLDRLMDAAHAGAAGDGLPLVLDEPFDGLGAEATRDLLSVVGERAGQPQVVLLTDDPEVIEWARLEALGGGVALVEPVHDRVTID